MKSFQRGEMGEEAEGTEDGLPFLPLPCLSAGMRYHEIPEPVPHSRALHHGPVRSGRERSLPGLGRCQRSSPHSCSTDQTSTSESAATECLTCAAACGGALKPAEAFAPLTATARFS
jgi:hypothetical protein